MGAYHQAINAFGLEMRTNGLENRIEQKIDHIIDELQKFKDGILELFTQQ